LIWIYKKTLRDEKNGTVNFAVLCIVAYWLHDPLSPAGSTLAIELERMKDAIAIFQEELELQNGLLCRFCHRK
jgi:hypothetical protein